MAGPKRKKKKIMPNHKAAMRIVDKQTFRYMKTVLWMDGKGPDVLQRCAETKIMENYPVDAKTLEEAEQMLKSQTGLRSTGISHTDLTAIGDCVKEWKRLQDQNETNQE